MLKCDFGNLAREVERLTAANAKVLHWDVMDGHFVPNLSYGPMVIERVRPLTEMVFDAHLMISEPEKCLDEYLKAGCEAITVHIEAVPQPTSLLRRIRDAGRVAGLGAESADSAVGGHTVFGRDRLAAGDECAGGIRRAIVHSDVDREAETSSADDLVRDDSVGRRWHRDEDDRRMRRSRNRPVRCWQARFSIRVITELRLRN